jgi:hypothetical protein
MRYKKLPARNRQLTVPPTVVCIRKRNGKRNKKRIMKQLSIVILLLIFVSKANSQIHCLINKDSIPNCEIIKSGKFINKQTDCDATPDYYIIYSDGYVTDYVNGGKFYVKSKITYESSCKWKSEIIEITIPDYNLKPGHKILTEVIETATVDNLVKIKVRIEGETKEHIFVLEKIE